jgi:peroxiredoxin Q/BCP
MVRARGTTEMPRASTVRAYGVGILFAVALAACGETTRPDGGVGLLSVGAAAPEIVGEDAAGNPVKLSDQKGKMSVVFFYPKDGTPGCTKQACAFRDAFDKLQKAGVTVFGVSRDSVESHREFRKEHQLPFAMVADESGAAMTAYGVPAKYFIMSDRVTFLVDDQGKIAQVWPEVDPAVDADRVLAASKEISAGTPS